MMQQLIYVLVLALYCVSSSHEQAVPVRPSISETFVSLISVNFTNKVDPGSSFNGIERVAVDKMTQKKVINVTDNDRTVHVSQFYLYNTNKGYQIDWNDDVSDGQCSKMAPGRYQAMFEWVAQASFVGYTEFLDWNTWGIASDNQQEYAILVVPASNPNQPVLIGVQNETISFEMVFLNFEGRQPPEEYFQVPSKCTTGQQQQRQIKPSTAGFNAHDVLSRINSLISTGRPNLIKGDGKAKMKKMVNRMIARHLK